MAIGINLRNDHEDDNIGPFSRWAEDFEEDTPQKDFAEKLFVAGPPEDYIPIRELWWGYKHTSGTYQAKRYFGPLDTDEARDSPFCEQVVGPFPAKDREEALQLVKEKTT